MNYVDQKYLFIILFRSLWQLVSWPFMAQSRNSILFHVTPRNRMGPFLHFCSILSCCFSWPSFVLTLVISMVCACNKVSIINSCDIVKELRSHIVKTCSHVGIEQIGKIQAFQAAWAAACKVKGSTIAVPSEFIFLVGPISFSGPYCEEDIVFQVNSSKRR